MSYSKPEINLLALAAKAIQGSSDKSSPIAPEILNGPAIATQMAYEADE